MDIAEALARLVARGRAVLREALGEAPLCLCNSKPAQGAKSDLPHFRFTRFRNARWPRGALSKFASQSCLALSPRKVPST